RSNARTRSVAKGQNLFLSSTLPREYSRAFGRWPRPLFFVLFSLRSPGPKSSMSSSCACAAGNSPPPRGRISLGGCLAWLFGRAARRLRIGKAKERVRDKQQLADPI